MNVKHADFGSTWETVKVSAIGTHQHQYKSPLAKKTCCFGRERYLITVVAITETLITHD